VYVISSKVADMAGKWVGWMGLNWTRRSSIAWVVAIHEVAKWKPSQPLL
jgi:hypothetical protein